jgi:hypothetical protein
MGSILLAALFRISAILPLSGFNGKGDTGGMHPYLASDLAHERVAEFRRQADRYRPLTQVRPTRPGRLTSVAAFLRRGGSSHGLARRFGRRMPGSVGRPVPCT